MRRFFQKAAAFFVRHVGPQAVKSTAHIKSGKPRGRLLFVNKKKQKNFVSSGRAVSLPPAQRRRSFCAAFFKKRLLSLSDTSARRQ
ncbi:MAG TPA: hypothetical protein VL356_04005 [Acidocella sp.]|nr:hypothetical protein [Acidocella sp.]